jgi:TP901 family phage tail tape measure protein
VISIANLSIAADLIGKDLLSPAVHSALGSLNSFEAAGNRANTMLGGLAGNIAKAGAAMGALAFGGVVTGIGAATTAAMGFEKTMSGIAAVSGLDQTGAQFKALSDLALKLGADTSFSASEAAKGMEEMVKAGVSLEDVMAGAAAATLDLAAAGGVEVAEAATIASNAMNTFSKSGADMAHIADLLAGAANASAISVHDLGFSLSAVGAVAATVGLTIEDTTTAIAVLGQAGLKGSDAGTSLKTMLMGLQPTTKAQTAAFKELGIVTKDGSNQFFDAAGHAKSMADIAGILQKATMGLTDAQKLQKLEMMFGTDAIRAAAIMAKAGSAGFDAMADSMSKVTAQTVAAERLNNLAGSLEKLKGSLETAAISLGAHFTPGLKTLADRATEAVNAALPMINTYGDQIVAAFDAAAVSLGSLGEQFSAWLILAKDVLTIGVPDALAELRTRFADVETFIVDHWQAALVGAFGAVGLAMVASAGMGIAAWLPVVVPIAAVGVAIAALYEAWQDNLGGIQEQTQDFYDDTIRPTFNNLVDWFKDRIPSAMKWLVETGWPAIVAAGQKFVNFLTGPAATAFGQLRDWFGTTLPPLFDWLTQTAWPNLQTAGQQVADFLTGPAATAFENLRAWLADTLPPIFSTFTNETIPAMSTALDTLSRWVQNAWDWLVKLGDEVAEKQVYEDLWAAWNNLKDIAGILAKGIVDILNPASSLNTIMGGEGGLKDSTTTTADNIKILSKAIADFTGFVKDVLDPLGKMVEGLFILKALAAGGLGNPFFDLPKWLKEQGIELPDWIGIKGAPRYPGSPQTGGILNPTPGAPPVTASPALGPILGPPVPAPAVVPPKMGGSFGGVTGVDVTGYWQQQAAAAAKAAGLDQFLFLSQIQQESGFAPDVISGARRSSAGAMGIAQIMPGTAKAWGVDPLDPVAALAAAATNMKKYIDDYMKETGGDPTTSTKMALAAYNAGPGNVARYGLSGVMDPSFAKGQTKDYIELILGRLLPGSVEQVNALNASLQQVPAATAGAANGMTTMVDTAMVPMGVTAVETGTQVGTGMMGSINDGLTNQTPLVISTAADINDQLTGAITPTNNVTNEIGVGTVTGIADGLTETTGVVVGVAADVNGQIVGAITPAPEVTTAIGYDVTNTMGAGVTNGAPVVVGAATLVNGQVISALVPAVQGATDIGEAIPSGMAQGIKDGTEDVVAAIDRMMKKAEAAYALGDAGAFEDAFNVNMPPLIGRASGGPVHPRTPYLIGEEGPEVLWMGSSGGYISPNSTLRGGGSGGGIDYARLAKELAAVLASSGAGRTINVYPAQAMLTEEGLERTLYREELRTRW